MEPYYGQIYDSEFVFIFLITFICSQVLFMFLFAILQGLGEECYHIWRVILINENLFVTHPGYGRLITKEQNKGGSQVRANKEEQ